MEKALQQLDNLLSDCWVGVSREYYNQHKNEPQCLLHLCGQRVRADAVRHFLEEYRVEHDGSCRKLLLYQDPESGATPLHVALHRNSWSVTAIVQLLLEAAPELAGIPMKGADSVVYPLHVACSHLGDDRDDKGDLLRLLLQACPEVVNAMTECGSTPLRTLFAVNKRQQRPRSVTLLIEPAMLLAQAALGLKETDQMTWYSLCSLHLCPAELIHILLLHENCTRIDFGSFRTPDPATGGWPLHAAARHGDDALVQLVLQQDPTAASRIDSRGRLPLHCAVSNPNLLRPQSSLVRLARAHLSALSLPDPVTGLYPFMAAASNQNVQASFELLQLEPTVYKN